MSTKPRSTRRKSDRLRFGLPDVFVYLPAGSALKRLCNVAESAECNGPPLLQLLLNDAEAVVERKLADQGTPVARDRPEWLKNLVGQSVQLHKLAILQNAHLFEPAKRTSRARHEPLAAMFAMGWYSAAARHSPRKSRIALADEVARALGPGLTRFDVERLVARFEHRRENLRRTDKTKDPGARIEPLFAAAIEEAGGLMLEFYGRWANLPSTVH